MEMIRQSQCFYSLIGYQDLTSVRVKPAANIVVFLLRRASHGFLLIKTSIVSTPAYCSPCEHGHKSHEQGLFSGIL